jgi:hypothetical protein
MVMMMMISFVPLAQFEEVAFANHSVLALRQSEIKNETTIADFATERWQ